MRWNWSFFTLTGSGTEQPTGARRQSWLCCCLAACCREALAVHHSITVASVCHCCVCGCVVRHCNINTIIISCVCSCCCVCGCCHRWHGLISCSKQRQQLHWSFQHEWAPNDGSELKVACDAVVVPSASWHWTLSLPSLCSSSCFPKNLSPALSTKACNPETLWTTAQNFAVFLLVSCRHKPGSVQDHCSWLFCYSNNAPKWALLPLLVAARAHSPVKGVSIAVRWIINRSAATAAANNNNNNDKVKGMNKEKQKRSFWQGAHAGFHEWGSSHQHSQRSFQWGIQTGFRKWVVNMGRTDSTDRTGSLPERKELIVLTLMNQMNRRRKGRKEMEQRWREGQSQTQCIVALVMAIVGLNRSMPSSKEPKLIILLCLGWESKCHATILPVWIDRCMVMLWKNQWKVLNLEISKIQFVIVLTESWLMANVPTMICVGTNVWFTNLRTRNLERFTEEPQLGI